METCWFCKKEVPRKELVKYSYRVAFQKQLEGNQHAEIVVPVPRCRACGTIVWRAWFFCALIFSALFGLALSGLAMLDHLVHPWLGLVFGIYPGIITGLALAANYRFTPLKHYPPIKELLNQGWE